MAKHLRRHLIKRFFTFLTIPLSVIFSSSAFAADCCDSPSSISRFARVLTPKLEIEAVENRGLKTALLSEYSTIEAGKPFRVALEQKPYPSFHTYWKNPGIVGIPSSIEWTLPEGFKAGEIQWPYPQLCQMRAYPCYGYRRPVLLMVTITPPKTLPIGPFELKAEANWMCCYNKNCFPTWKNFSLKLNAGKEKEKSENFEKFAQASKELPVQTDSISAKLSSANDAKAIVVELSSEHPFKPIHLFGLDEQTLPNLEYSLKEISPTNWIFKAERNKTSPKGKTSFPFILKTSDGYFKMKADR